jgi:hypothetical protein
MELLSSITFPIVLTLFGAVLILMGIAGNITLKGINVKLSEKRQILSAVLGGLLVLASITMYSLEEIAVPKEDPSPTPTISQTITIDQSIPTQNEAADIIQNETLTYTLSPTTEELTSTPTPRITLTPSTVPEVTLPSPASPNISDEGASTVQIVTGIGREITLTYENVDTDDEVLNYIMGRLENDYGVHFIPLLTNDVINLLFPLKDFQYAVKPENLEEQVILLNNAEEIVGNLMAFLVGEDESIYDLGTAKEVMLLNLAMSDNNMVDVDIEGSREWILEIIEPIKATYNVIDPRFVFQYSGYTAGGSIYVRETEARNFYIITDNETQYLSNINDVDEIRIEPDDYKPDKVVVKVGDVVTNGHIKVVSDDLDREDNWWHLVVNMVDSDKILVLSNGTEPTFELRKVK